MDYLPKDMWREICLYLDFDDIKTFNTTFTDLVNDDFFWSKYFKMRNLPFIKRESVVDHYKEKYEKINVDSTFEIKITRNCLNNYKYYDTRTYEKFTKAIDILNIKINITNDNINVSPDNLRYYICYLSNIKYINFIWTLEVNVYSTDDLQPILLGNIVISDKILDQLILLLENYV